MGVEGRDTILLVGAGGQLGTELRAPLARVGTVVAVTRAELDLRDPSAIRQVVRAAAPAAIVNAAAFTSLDRAESDHATAFAVNAEAPGILAREAERTGALLVHYSTDYVFDGTSRRPYREDDPPNPLSAYAASKLAGEQAVAAAGAPHVVLRVSWVYGSHGTNFVRSILRAARERPELRVVEDQVGVPTWSASIAEATAELLRRHRHGDRFALPAGASGVYHLASSGETSRFDFVRRVLALDPRAAEQVVERIVPITSAEFPSPARRPAYSALDSSLAHERFGIRIADWDGDLERAMRRGIRPADRT